jgi:hypothetical protein
MMSFAAGGVLGGKKASDTENYYFDFEEIGVRLAALKRDYARLTGELATEDNLGEVLKHAMKNKEQYSKDALELLASLNLAIKNGKQKEFLLHLKDNIDNVVQNKNTNAKQMA